MNTAYQWNPADYAQNSQGQERWARELLELAAIKADDRVLDIGCGDGRMTAEIARRAHQGRVIGVDRSAEMVEFASRTFPPAQYPNLSFRQTDARGLPFESEFTLVYSSAVLHWVREHQPVLAGIARSLRPGGRIVLQMGGKGNTMDVAGAFEECFRDLAWRHAAKGFEFPYSFYGAEEYRVWLEEAGLVPDAVELLDRDMVHPSRAAFTGWLRTAWLPFHAALQDGERDAFLETVTDCFIRQNPLDVRGQVHAHAVRLQVLAHK